MRLCNAGNTVDGIARKRKDLAVGEEPLHPNCGLRCLRHFRRRFRQGWRFIRLAGGPGGQADRMAVFRFAIKSANQSRKMFSIELQIIKFQ